MKGGCIVKFESLDMINSVITAIDTRRMEKVDLYFKMLDHEPRYPSVERKYAREIETLRNAVECLRDYRFEF